MDLSFLGPSAASVVVVLLFLNYMSKKDAAQAVRDEMVAEALKALKESSDRVANATEKQALEAAQRNGHLAEIAADNQKVNLKVLKEIKGAVVKGLGGRK